MKGQCNKSLKMLLSRGIEDLHDDGFEGSIDEDRIFRDVFFGHESGRSSKRCLVTGAINFENDDSKPKNVSFLSNSEYSVMAGHEDFQNNKEDSGQGTLSEAKRQKLSVEEHSNAKSYLEKVVDSSTPSKEVDSCLCPPDPIVTCRLVESSGQGVKSSCYLLKVGNRDVSKHRLSEANASPALQESHASKLLVSRPEPVQRARRRPKDSSFVGLDEEEMLVTLKDSIMDPKPLLRYHVHLLLRAATANASSGGSESICPHQDGSYLALDATLKENAHKKSKKIAEIELTHLYRHDQLGVKRSARAPNVVRKYKSQKGSCRLLPRSLTKGGKHHWPGLGVTTVLSWLIGSGVIRLKEAIQYRNPKDGSVVKDGLVTHDGILCRCCQKVLSVSRFKRHAGFILKRPCLNLFMESGKSFTLCQLEAWSAEYKVRHGGTRPVQVEEIDQNDDSCGLCGDGGELICCDNCPSTFHQACLCVQGLPEGDWYCSMCSCWSCGNFVSNSNTLIVGALKCLQCKHKYHEECVMGAEGGLVPSTWFCGESCKEIHCGLDSRVGLMNLISDGFSWTLLRCIHGDPKVWSDQPFVALKAECNVKLAVALTIMEECFLPMVDPRTGIDMIPHVVYNRGSEFARLNYEGFHTVVLEKDDMLLCVASIRIHGIEVAEMPLIATCSKYQRQGMCRRLMNAIEELLKSLKIEKLVLSAIPSLVETWTDGFGFTPLEAEEKKSLSKTNLMVFPGTVWLKKPMYQHVNTEGTPTWSNVDLEEATSLMEFVPIDCKQQEDVKVKQALKLSREEPQPQPQPHSRFTTGSPEMVCGVKSSIKYGSRELPILVHTNQQ